MAYRSNRILEEYSAEWSAAAFRRRSQGSALLLVLFAIILLTGLITATVGFVKNDVDEYGAVNKEFRARQLAESGLAFGIHPLVKNEDRSLLEQETPDGGRFQVLISSESTKLNINFILQAGRDDLLENLFARWGVAPKDAKAAIKGLRNYLSNPLRTQSALQSTEGGQPASISTNATQPTSQSANSAQSGAQSTNAAQPAAPAPGTNVPQIGQQFAAVEEMSLVPEFGPVMEKQPDWSDFFTIWGDGTIDVNLADADTIALITGVSPATADHFVKYRWGPDGKPFTLDDRVYTTADEVRAALGMSPEQFQLVEPLLSLISAVDRIESTGIIAGYEKTIIVTVTRNTTPVRYLSWQEK
jgi:general secretion pathway protein K